MVVEVTGGSGSGKSEFVRFLADKLQALLDPKAYCVFPDTYLQNRLHELFAHFVPPHRDAAVRQYKEQQRELIAAVSCSRRESRRLRRSFARRYFRYRASRCMSNCLFIIDEGLVQWPELLVSRAQTVEAAETASLAIRSFPAKLWPDVVVWIGVDLPTRQARLAQRGRLPLPDRSPEARHCALAKSDQIHHSLLRRRPARCRHIVCDNHGDLAALRTKAEQMAYQLVGDCFAARLFAVGHRPLSRTA